MFAVLYSIDKNAVTADEESGWILWGVFTDREIADRSLEECWRNPNVVQVRLLEQVD